ncbi:MAG: hypothetical protein HC866_17770 [Leptolyngbyaceae cyanobacterium RU_5_1]|nr:hypothetical protein [Leptolyngbyaceae cyanobacterium RU_5_1]
MQRLRLPKQPLLRKPVPKSTPSPKSTSAPPTVAQPTPTKPVAEAPKPDTSPLPKPSSSPPPLKLTPEQTLIARIQDQVAEVSNQYVSGLIQSVQANFRSSRLTVNVGEGWYSLEDAQQNKLSNEMLKRAQQLDFIKLEITDPEGTLLARSPVVGSEMVIIRRGGRGEGQAAADRSISSSVLTPFL